MAFDEFRARAILDAVHAAWSEADMDAMLRHYADDLVYWLNVGDPAGGPLKIVGKAGLRDFLVGIATVVESVSVVEYFRVADDGVGRSQIAAYVKHKVTGLALSGTYRQVITFRDGKIVRLEEYHDAAKMAAFWRLIADESRAREPGAPLKGKAKRPQKAAQ
jgi:ketosteroid isomerase-like protein